MYLFIYCNSLFTVALLVNNAESLLTDTCYSYCTCLKARTVG